MAAASLTALLFGLHPIHVESVAWAWERKDVLYAFFYLSGILLYLDYAIDSGQKKLKLYACLGLYLLALMSKPMAVTLPLVFLIFDGWPLKRLANGLSKALVEKIPFFVLAAVISLITRLEMAQVSSINQNLSLGFRISNALYAPVFYLYKMVLPLGLTPFYPFPHELTSVYYLEHFFSILGVIIFTLVCFYFRKNNPWLGAAWLFYLVSLAPVLGLIQVGSYSAADRYTYLPSLGIFLPLSALVSVFLLKRRLPLVVFCAAITVLLGFGTMKQIGVWKNSQTFWECVVNHYPDDNPNALTNLGAVYMKAGRLDDALALFKRATAIHRPLVFTHEQLGTALMYKGQVEEAIREFKIAQSLDPKDNQSYQNLWKIL